MFYHYIYKTINKINGKYYYGIHSSNDLNDNYLGSGKNLKKDIKIFGKENFEKIILAVYYSREEILYIEKNVVTKHLINDENCYNIRQGGGARHFEGGRKYIPSSDQKHRLKGIKRTKKQRISSINHSVRMKGKSPSNKMEIILFGTKYSSVNMAIKKLGLSTSQYYFMIKNPNIIFNNSQELKEYTWKLRNQNISKTRKIRYGKGK